MHLLHVQLIMADCNPPRERFRRSTFITEGRGSLADSS